MSENDIAKLCVLFAAAFRAGQKGQLSKVEIITLFGVGSVNEGSIENVARATGTAESSLRAGTGTPASLLKKGLIQCGKKKHGGTFLNIYSLTEEGWDVLHVILTGKLRAREAKGA